MIEMLLDPPLLVCYNARNINGFDLSAPLFEKMPATDRCADIKNSSDSVQDILRFRMAGGGDIAIHALHDGIQRTTERYR